MHLHRYRGSKVSWRPRGLSRDVDVWATSQYHPPGSFVTGCHRRGSRQYRQQVLPPAVGWQLISYGRLHQSPVVVRRGCGEMSILDKYWRRPTRSPQCSSTWLLRSGIPASRRGQFRYPGTILRVHLPHGYRCRFLLVSKDGRRGTCLCPLITSDLVRRHNVLLPD